jgi:hypothetical protein
LRVSAKALKIARWAIALSSAQALGLCLLLFVDSLSLSHYPLTHRITYEQKIDLVLVSADIDELLTKILLAFSFLFCSTMLYSRGCRVEAFIAVPAGLLSALAPRYALTTFAPFVIALIFALSYKAGLLSRLLAGMLICALTLEAISMSYWIVYPLCNHEVLAKASQLQSGLFYLAGRLSPILVVLLLFSWPLSAFDHWVARIRGLSLDKGGVALKLATPESVMRRPGEGDLSPSSKVLVLLTAVGLSWFVVAYPYLPSLNESGKYVSVDAPFYEGYLRTALGLGGTELLRYVFGRMSERSLAVLTMYSLAAPTGLAPELVVKGFPLLLSLLLAISSYFAVVRITYDQRLAAYSALLSGTSIVTVVGMYAGYYANWLATSMALLALGFAFGYADLGEPSYLLGACAFLILAELSHVWTWYFFCAVLFALLLHQMLFEGLLRRKVLDVNKALSLSLPVATSLLFDLFKRNFLGVGTTGAEVGLGTASSGLRVLNIFLFERNLSCMLEVFVGGLTSNALYFALAMLAVLLPSRDEDLSALFSASLFVTSFPFLFYDYVLQSRLLYVLPVHLMTAKGAYDASRVIRERGFRLQSGLFLALCFLSSANYALRSSANLV